MPAAASRMSKDGYTLTEMLAALVILGLAMGGLFQGVRIIGLVQASANRAVALARTEAGPQASLEQLVASRGPFQSTDSETFEGSASRFSFPCADDSVCSATILDRTGAAMLQIAAGRRRSNVVIAGSGQASFRYIGEQTVGDVWPAARAPRERLVRIVLLRQRLNGATPIASVRLWKEQPRDCAYDVIAEACRSAAS